MNAELLKGTVALPDPLVKLGHRPGDPPHCSFYGMETEGSKDIIQYMPISKEYAMEYGDLKGLIDGIHGALGESQGLIEVGTGKTAKGKDYIYSIIKTLLPPEKGGGVTYTLCLDADYPEFCFRMMGYFNENGITGMRDSMVLELERRKNENEPFEELMKRWMKDPYDENYTKGIRMNLSEQKEYDAQFPGHPLSVGRMIVDYYISNN
jgi:hypothetical protein